jgi:tRNA pseudouridine55 synthase
MATGVLLVCLGRATRITEYLMAGRKRYRAEVLLGVSTDSHDADGEVTGTSPVTVTRAEVETALSHFQGSIEQVPPMVSAIKHDGQPLYKLSRRGITVERSARPVTIYELTLINWRTPVLTLEVECSSGTYLRALAHDLGKQLGCGAHLTALTRLASGEFTLGQAIEMDQFSAAVTASDEEGRDAQRRIHAPRWHDLVMPLDAGLRQFPAITLGIEDSRRIRSGQHLTAKLFAVPTDGLCRAYSDCDGVKTLIALLKFDEKADLWRPHKVFYPL